MRKQHPLGDDASVVELAQNDDLGAQIPLVLVRNALEVVNRATLLEHVRPGLFLEGSTLCSRQLLSQDSLSLVFASYVGVKIKIDKMR